MPSPKKQGKKLPEWLHEIKEGNKVCVLKRSLYGLRQAGRQWNKKLNQELQKLEMKPLDSDPCVYIAKRGNDTLFLAVYVDDMLVILQNLLWISELKEKLKIPFELKGLGFKYDSISRRTGDGRNRSWIFIYII